jgi:long-chain acyl-CoA synthetase
MIETLEEAASRGMAIAWHARVDTGRPAVVSAYGSRTFGELNANANRLVRTVRRVGVADGDAVAVIARNLPEFIEAYAAAERSGIRLTPINYHLKSDEIAYIVDNCEAKVFIADAGLGEAPAEALQRLKGVRLALAVGGGLTGFDDYASAIATASADDIEDPSLGTRMLYTSGTTGRPKGVYRRDREPVMPSLDGPDGYRPGFDMNLCTGPAYHAAPLLVDIIRPLVSGVGTVLMERFDPEETLRLIDRHRITHTHMVATMFHRLLQLPDDVKRRYDLSSLRRVVHGAAPCPVHIKRAMIEWLGPIIWEYYAATEGGGGFLVGSEEWLKKPGTVGKPAPGFDNRILDDEGDEVPAGQVGTIYMRAPERGRFEYFKDIGKTAGSYRGDYFTLGDMGYFDEDGYLFLTGRSAELIISGGVNIYPQEVDNELLRHPAVLDVCTIGVPNVEFGEEVKSLVQLRAGHAPSDALRGELIAWVRARLAHFKCPRTIDFRDDLPRLPSGKIQRRLVRDAFWPAPERN